MKTYSRNLPSDQVERNLGPISAKAEDSSELSAKARAVAKLTTSASRKGANAIMSYSVSTKHKDRKKPELGWIAEASGTAIIEKRRGRGRFARN
jgi:uncharacterized protein YbjQ (UPF0145 family)